MKNTNKLISLILIGLMMTVLSLSFLNNKKANSYDNEIIIYNNEEEIAVINQDVFSSLQSVNFDANRESNGVVHEEFNFTGVALIDILVELDINTSEVKSVLMTSKDGYTVELTAAEAFDKDNLFIVFEKDGQPLDETWGEYASIVRKDDFSKRWSKQLVSINFK